MNSPPDEPCLWSLTAAGGLAGRALLDRTIRVPLEALASGTTLGARRADLRDACVLLRTSTQRAAALALLELDGLARRIVLCTPDLTDEQVRLAAGVAEATVVVSDRGQIGGQIGDVGLPRVIVDSASFGPADAPPGGGRPTEWALFTSGTTGPPKLALHTVRALTGAMTQTPPSGGVWATFYDIRRYGGLQILLRALLGGGSMVLSDPDEAVGDFLTRAAAADVTFISGTPTHWRRALLSPAAAAIAPADVRLSGEVADQSILDKLRERYPAARVRHAFASTEAGVAFEVADGLVGFPVAWTERRDGAVDLAVVDGTLRIRSNRTASRYLGHDGLGDGDGFVDTKDLVEQRGERFHFLGRSDGVINVGGLKVHPEEVEAVVNRHPRVEMSRARAKRSPIIGSVVAVDVVLCDSAPPGDLEAAILESCRQSMAWWKVPVVVKVVPSLTVSPAGKLVRTGG